ncbi:NAD(P)H-dependent oxidoreductase [Mesorhizobium sp. J428]|uniref:NAD(P)H-dependent oxidoreductase n=1 Tax=Mesorhizobium sp. J428 TaxID=2898440 RepID=UPI0021519375|nr:NAD(P)H-dependent oxidoreductase [Mesorhizobium sp. J428]MCR5855429.1 NAD(P)H-dependent oxidoreductase [Mesorhizobium sp. J428]
MRILLVYCHPVPESFAASIRDEAIASLEARGHEVRLLDLYAIGFDPVMGAEERRRYNHLPAEHHPLPEHIAHLRWAEGLVFVYPTWWYGLPAMLKGWLDRVWAPGVAFSMPEPNAKIGPLMTHIRLLGVITTCGAPMWWSYVVGHPGRRTITRGIRALCARRCRTFFMAHYLMDSSTDTTRRNFLAKVRKKLAKV